MFFNIKVLFKIKLFFKIKVFSVLKNQEIRYELLTRTSTI